MNFIQSEDDIAEPAEANQVFDKLNCVVVERDDLSVAAPKEGQSSVLQGVLSLSLSLSLLHCN